MAKLVHTVPEEDQKPVTDAADRFDLVHSIVEGQRDHLHGVIEYFQSASART
jgi:hypothetical protein